MSLCRNHAPHPRDALWVSCGSGVRFLVVTGCCGGTASCVFSPGCRAQLTHLSTDFFMLSVIHRTTPNFSNQTFATLHIFTCPVAGMPKGTGEFFLPTCQRHTPEPGSCHPRTHKFPLYPTTQLAPWSAQASAPILYSRKMRTAQSSLPPFQVGRRASTSPAVVSGYSQLPCLATDPAHHRLAVNSDFHLDPVALPGASRTMGSNTLGSSQSTPTTFFSKCFVG